jgi:hypothetical protein
MQLLFEPNNQGSRPWYGNFDLGIGFANHPRWWEIAVHFIFFSVILSVKRK